MPQTYAQIQQQIVTLQDQAEKLRKKELDEVVMKIKEAIAVYGITPDMLYGRTKTAASARTNTAGNSIKNKRSPGDKAFVYADSSGNGWGGRGPRPAWLRAGLAAGKTLEDFRV